MHFWCQQASCPCDIMSSFPKTDGGWLGEDGGSCSLTHLEGPGGGRFLWTGAMTPKAKLFCRCGLVARWQPSNRAVQHMPRPCWLACHLCPQTELTKHDLWALLSRWDMFLDKSRVGLIQPYEESGAVVGVKLIRPGAKLCPFAQPCQFAIRQVPSAWLKTGKGIVSSVIRWSVLAPWPFLARGKRRVVSVTHCASWELETKRQLWSGISQLHPVGDSVIHCKDKGCRETFALAAQALHFGAEKELIVLVQSVNISKCWEGSIEYFIGPWTLYWELSHPKQLPKPLPPTFICKRGVTIETDTWPQVKSS